MSGAKYLGAIVAMAALIAGCANDTPEPERMVITPKSLTFSATDTTKSISITHTCTCPFTWWASVPTEATWLNFPASMQGDHQDVAVSINPAKLTADSAHCFVRITSNAYGIDSIEVMAHR